MPILVPLFLRVILSNLMIEIAFVISPGVILPVYDFAISYSYALKPLSYSHKTFKLYAHLRKLYTRLYKILKPFWIHVELFESIFYLFSGIIERVPVLRSLNCSQCKQLACTESPTWQDIQQTCKYCLFKQSKNVFLIAFK